MSELDNFKEYVLEQQDFARGVNPYNDEYDFTLELLDQYQDSEKPQLKPDQKLVLEWLKENCKDYSAWYSFSVLARENVEGELNDDTHDAYSNVIDDDKQLAQVIQAFTDWWLSENDR